MFNKKTVVAATLLLLVSAGAVAGASQIASQQEPAGEVVVATGAVTDADVGAPASSGVPSAPALPPARGQVAFSDAFDAGNINGWHTLPEADHPWVARDGRLQQWGTVDAGNADEPTVLVTNDASFGDGIFEAQLHPTSGSPAGLVFGGSDAGYYRLTLLVQQPAGYGQGVAKARLDRVTASGVEEVAVNKSWAGYSLLTWQRVEVNTQANRITISVDGQQLFDVTGTDTTSGWVGVWTFADRGAQFDNVRVQRPVAGR
jgi:hypothetical protein